MKKLKTKLFLTIFIILTSFLLSILILSNYQNYQIRKTSINDILERLKVSLENINKPPRPFNELPPQDKINEDKNKIFLDFKVYTVLLDDNNNYKEVVNHTELDIDEKKIKSIVSEITKYKKDRNIHIGNLYFKKYAYTYINSNTLIIMDNTLIKEELIKYLCLTIILFIVLELIVCFISYVLTNWLIKPVINSFEKQKQFIEDASHELKTPLSIISASTSAFYNDKDLKWINNIKSETERMSKLVITLLDLAKIEKSNRNNYSNVNISKVVESSILTFESIFYEKNIEIEYDITKDIYIKCNEEEIRRLISILLDNAICYGEEDGRVIVNLKKNNKEVVLEVKNKGLPIEKDRLEKIFERFYREDTSRNRDNNRYGLGLAIAKAITKNIGGKITASSLDGYTTFKVLINTKSNSKEFL